MLVFDFDGVLFDTAGESLQVTFRAARSYAFAAPWRTLDTLPPDLTELFFRYRHRVGPPWQFALLLEQIATSSISATTAEFLAIAASRRAELEGFTDIYFANRRELEQDMPRWLALSKPYPVATQAFAKHFRGDNVAILSTRDEGSIHRLFGHYLPKVEPALLPRAGAREKWELLTAAATARDIAIGDVFFIDDFLQHAAPAKRHGVSAALATWGYLGNTDIAEATSAGIPCIAIDDLDRVLTEHETRASS